MAGKYYCYWWGDECESCQSFLQYCTKWKEQWERMLICGLLLIGKDTVVQYYYQSIREHSFLISFLLKTGIGIRTKWFVNGLRQAYGKLIFYEPEANAGQTIVSAHTRQTYMTNILVAVSQKCLRRCKNLSTWCTQFPLCLHKKTTNFGLWWVVCELFADGAAHTFAVLSTHMWRETNLISENKFSRYELLKLEASFLPPNW